MPLGEYHCKAPCGHHHAHPRPRATWCNLHFYFEHVWQAVNQEDLIVRTWLILWGLSFATTKFPICRLIKADRSRDVYTCAKLVYVLKSVAVSDISLSNTFWPEGMGGEVVDNRIPAATVVLEPLNWYYAIHMSQNDYALILVLHLSTTLGSASSLKHW